VTEKKKKERNTFPKVFLVGDCHQGMPLLRVIVRKTHPAIPASLSCTTDTSFWSLSPRGSRNFAIEMPPFLEQRAGSQPALWISQ
jgi:hypothetical protein